jgi:mono/diheme cytochrome c family protein
MRRDLRTGIGDQSPAERASVRRSSAGLLALCAAVTLGAAGCRQDMHNQPKMIPQRESVVFADHRSARPQIENTVARGQLKEDSYFYTGTVAGANGYREEKDLLPFPATMAVLQKGEERFNIYCTPCHSRVGNGLGAIVQRGYKPAGNLNDQVRRAQPLSHYFYVMTHGYGAMPDYSSQLTPEERWSVAAYIRALQLSQNATRADVASGAQVQSLKDVATAKGLDASYAQPWELPTTAVEAYPATGEGKPGMAPGYPADPKIFVPHSGAANTKTNSNQTNTPHAAPAAPAGN